MRSFTHKLDSSLLTICKGLWVCLNTIVVSTSINQSNEVTGWLLESNSRQQLTVTTTVPYGYYKYCKLLKMPQLAIKKKLNQPTMWVSTHVARGMYVSGTST